MLKIIFLLFLLFSVELELELLFKLFAKSVLSASISHNLELNILDCELDFFQSFLIFTFLEFIFLRLLKLLKLCCALFNSSDFL